MLTMIQGSVGLRRFSYALVLALLCSSLVGIGQQMANSNITSARTLAFRAVGNLMPVKSNETFELAKDTPEAFTKTNALALEFAESKMEDIVSNTIGNLERTNFNLKSALTHERFLNKSPIVLKEFQSDFDNTKPSLHWISSVEDNLNYYCVQRSMDGLDFQDVAYVFPEGMHLVDSKYSYTDTEIPAGTIGVLYYRLKMKEANGTEEFSNVKTVYLGLGDRTVFQRVVFDGTIKSLSYAVRTTQRPEMESEQDVHPWPSKDAMLQGSEKSDDNKFQWKDKMKNLWDKTNKLVKTL